MSLLAIFDENLSKRFGHHTAVIISGKTIIMTNYIPTLGECGGERELASHSSSSSLEYIVHARSPVYTVYARALCMETY